MPVTPRHSNPQSTSAKSMDLSASRQHLPSARRGDAGVVSACNRTTPKTLVLCFDGTGNEFTSSVCSSRTLPHFLPRGAASVRSCCVMLTLHATGLLCRTQTSSSSSACSNVRTSATREYTTECVVPPPNTNSRDLDVLPCAPVTCADWPWDRHKLRTHVHRGCTVEGP